MTEELKPCGHCGYRAKSKQSEQKGFRVACTNWLCICSTSYFERLASAEKSWNKRA